MANFLIPGRRRFIPQPGAPINLAHPLARGLVAYYPCNEGAGATINEATGLAGSMTGTANTSRLMWTPGSQFNVTPASPLSDQAAIVPNYWGNTSSGSGYFQGSNLASVDNLSNFTVQAWITQPLYAAGSGGGVIVGKYGSGGTSTGAGWAMFACNISSVFKLSMGTQQSGGSVFSEIDATATAFSVKNTPLHMVGTVSARAAQKIYFNGKDAGATSSGSGTPSGYSNTGLLCIGNDSGAPSTDFFSGAVSHVAIWNRVLSQNEIETLYADPYCMFKQPIIRRRGVLGKGPSTAQSLLPKGIQSAELFGAAGFSRIILPGGIISEEKFGSFGAGSSLLPLGIASHENFGADNIVNNPGSNVFPGGVTSEEKLGAENIVEGTGITPGGIASEEKLGEPTISINLLPLGITGAAVLGAIKITKGTKTPIVIPGRSTSKFIKPPLGSILDTSSSLTQGLAAALILSEGGGLQTKELVTGTNGAFTGTTKPTWFSGLFGSSAKFSQSIGSNILFPSRPSYTDMGLNGPMGVSFWFNFTTADISAGGVTLMGKSDSTDGTPGNTAGWNINCDNWTVAGGPNSGPHYYLKLEFERSVTNKMCGAQIDGLGLVPGWHHYVICSAGGAAMPTVDDYTIYLDGVLIPQGASNRMFFTGTGTNTTSDSGLSFSLGAHPDGSVPMAGGLDNLLFYKRVLTSDEAQKLYTDPFCYMKKRKNPFISLASNVLQFVFPGGIKTEEKFGAENANIPPSLGVTPLGITSAETAGAAILSTAQFLAPGGIVSEEAFKIIMTQIASIQDLFPGGIVSLEFVEDTNFSGFVITSPKGRIFKPFPLSRIFSE